MFANFLQALFVLCGLAEDKEMDMIEFMQIDCGQVCQMLDMYHAVKGF